MKSMKIRVNMWVQDQTVLKYARSFVNFTNKDVGNQTQWRHFLAVMLTLLGVIGDSVLDKSLFVPLS